MKQDKQQKQSIADQKRLPEHESLLNWLREAIPQHNGIDLEAFTIQALAGDASARKYLRLQPGKPLRDNEISTSIHSLIAMDCPPDASMQAFISVSKLLFDRDIRTPAIYSSDTNSGFMLLEDLGDNLLKTEITIDNADAIFRHDILPLLKRMSACDTQELASFDKKKIFEELNLFTDWYCDKHCDDPLLPREKLHWQQLSELLVENVISQKQIFVHRDFHCCNVMRLSNGEVAVIDFQDAVCGPASYDLISWIWDRYLHLPRATIEQWLLAAHHEMAIDIDQQSWIRQCDLMALQRNLKIVGIFCRLNYRDGKTHYLDLIPQFARYILQTLSQYHELDNVADFIAIRLQRAI